MDGDRSRTVVPPGIFAARLGTPKGGAQAQSANTDVPGEHHKRAPGADTPYPTTEAQRRPQNTAAPGGVGGASYTRPTSLPMGLWWPEATILLVLVMAPAALLWLVLDLLRAVPPIRGNWLNVANPFDFALKMATLDARSNAATSANTRSSP